MFKMQIATKVVSLPDIPRADGVFPGKAEFALKPDMPGRMMKLDHNTLNTWFPEHMQDLCGVTMRRLDLQGDVTDRDMMMASQLTAAILASAPSAATRVLILFTHAMPADTKAHAYVGAVCWLNN